MEHVLLTPAEARYVTGCSQAAAKQAVKEGIINVSVRKSRARDNRVLGWTELRYLRLTNELRTDLTPAGRRKLYKGLSEAPFDAHHAALGSLRVDLAQADYQIRDQLRRLDGLRRFAEPRATGGPLIRGTNVPIYAVAALVRRQTHAEILEDYPTLASRHVAAAAEYASAFPWRGRPYPTRSEARVCEEVDVFWKQIFGPD